MGIHYNLFHLVDTGYPFLLENWTSSKSMHQVFFLLTTKVTFGICWNFTKFCSLLLKVVHSVSILAFTIPFLVHLSRRLMCTIVIMRCPSSVGRPSVRRPSSLTFHIFDFSSETAKRNSMKLDRKQDLNVLYQVCVFRADRKNKMAALASDWLRHFRLLL